MCCLLCAVHQAAFIWQAWALAEESQGLIANARALLRQAVQADPTSVRAAALQPSLCTHTHIRI